MIQLSALREDCTKFVVCDGWLVGPLSPDSSSPIYEISRFRVLGDQIADARGMFGENIVYHDEARGEIVFAPFLNSCPPAFVHSASIDNDYQIKVFRSESPNDYVTAKYGYATDRATAHIRESGVYFHTAFAFESENRNVFTIWSVGVQIIGGKPRVTTAFKSTYACSLIPYYVKRSQHRVAYKASNNPPDLPWTSLDDSVSFEDIIAMEQFLEVSKFSDGTSQVLNLIPYSGIKPILSPSAARVAVELLIARMRGMREKSPLSEIDYGELAMRATEKINANNVNMLAFLHDLRHPTEMIPKLRNLASLKGWAGNFLSVKFGVMPTISDLQKIVDACKRVSPFLDKNGFSTYNSAEVQTAVYDGYTFEMKQHLKLAIGNEDSVFDELCERLDNIGMLPTLENIWDLIPYSFLIDWFVDVGGLLERVDTRLRLMQYNVEYVTMSYKTQISKRISWTEEFPFFGSLAVGLYHRWVTDQAPQPALSLQSSFDGFDHWLEAAALFIQRRK